VRDEHGPAAAFVHSHPSVHCAYTWALRDLAPGAIRGLRGPDASEDDDRI
jgi:hypothetical protein